jgi:CheY-like chemotaxis protein
MSQEFLEHLFEPYSRESHFSSRSTLGTGLGMPIVKSLVQQMSGEIMVESELGKGSKFTIILPMPVVSDQQQDLTSSSTKRSDVDLAGIHILLAEDNELNMEIATEILTMNGIQVTQAVNGLEALHLFETAAPYTFDAILMDMQMPEMDGCEATQAIRHLDRPDAADVPIIAVTANAFAEDIAKTTDAGMNGHISKPIDYKVLCQKLQELIHTISAATISALPEIYSLKKVLTCSAWTSSTTAFPSSMRYP